MAGIEPGWRLRDGTGVYNLIENEFVTLDDHERIVKNLRETLISNMSEYIRRRDMDTIQIKELEEEIAHEYERGWNDCQESHDGP